MSLSRQTIEAELRAGEHLDLAKAIHRRHYKKAIELSTQLVKLARMESTQQSTLPKDAIPQRNRSDLMSMTQRYTEFTTSIGSWSEVKAKLGNAWTTCLIPSIGRNVGDDWSSFWSKDTSEIPSEWQIMQASRDMLVDYIIPSNGEFYEHYDQNQYWLQFLRVLDEPSAMMDPTGLGVSREMIVQHLLRCTLHRGLRRWSPPYVSRRHRSPEEQLKLYVAGEHPRQAAIEKLIERQSYPQELLDALQLYKADPENIGNSIPLKPQRDDELFDFGVERFGTIGRLLNYACTLPRTPWKVKAFPLT